MTSKPESKLWHKLREGTQDLGVFWTRLESWATPGIPDLHGIIDGTSFWLELKVHRLKSLKSIALRPHQIAWQTRYFMNKGQVYNLVHHPSSSTLNIFGGERAIKMGETKGHAPLEPDWCCESPFDWHGVINHILSSSSQVKSNQDYDRDYDGETITTERGQ